MHAGVHAYYSGHEHVLQHHNANELHHFVCGASGAQPSGYYQGKGATLAMDWVDDSYSYGFVATTVYFDRMVVRFLRVMPSSSSCPFEVLREVVIAHSLEPAAVSR